MAYPRIPRTCERCGNGFSVRPYEVKRGWGRFCSKRCSGDARRTRPKKVSKPKGTFEQRFRARVNKTDTCWLWTASTNVDGYGHIKHEKRNYQAHRLSYEFLNGPIPDGLCVCHHCDVPRSVRPDHLFLGTKATNNLDMAMKERATSPLTTAQVRQIRMRYAKGGVTMKQLGIEFGVHKVTIRYIVRRLRWAHVD